MKHDKQKYIAIFCSSINLTKKYSKPANRMAHLLVNHGYNLVWGGTNTGLMKIVAQEVQVHGGKLIGVTMKIFRKLAKTDVEQMITAKSLGERKETMLIKSSAIVVLVGGIGTLDELAQILEMKREGYHTKPVVVLNTNNFYKGLQQQFNIMSQEGFLNKPMKDLVTFVSTPEKAFQYIDNSLKQQYADIEEM